VHRYERAAGLLAELGDRLGVPVRGRDVAYRGDFYGQDGRGAPLPEAITAGALVALLAALPEGASELGCHPGFVDDDLDSDYAAEREREVAALCDPSVRAAVEAGRIELVTFADVDASGGESPPAAAEA
jgi:predicted glycoside hydrolase/deacetylase ChbG (UPF0249 family)